MDNNKKFELKDEMLDNVAGGMDTDAAGTNPTAGAQARGMTLGMVYQVKQDWAKCNCGSHRFVVTGFLTDDTGFLEECEQCRRTGSATYAVYDMMIVG